MSSTLDTIMNRRSIRTYTDQKLSEDEIQTILKAGMSGPSCVNARDWSFIAVTDNTVLCNMAEANGRPAEPLKHAAFGILVCGDLERAFTGAPDYWIVDGAIACQNMILTAHEMGIGSVWLGTWPQMNRVRKQQELFGLPETVIPHSIIAFGYPENPNELNSPKPGRPEYEADRVHFNQW